ncbi:MAG: cytochrome c oxidase assembly protein subunit 15 [Flavobacteriaceae bacterium]|jgi:cytochrome c oxidase assembly protein subunit 15|tara:strand:+ start:3836 stop:4876 length:1041 start_codon:yes stop_codon:yes gene_type:complete
MKEKNLALFLMGKYYKSFIIISLVLVYLVISAGAIVRMTGSGMGCPDWPKCFGYLIPPTERNQLDWKSNHNYQEGEVIIVEESLRVVLQDFTSQNEYISENWDFYTKHNYALFNVKHTWIEFINRLLGALAGLATLLLLISALGRLKNDFWAAVGSLMILLGMGFQGWLGKTVVDSNLLPYKITIHLFMAFLILLILIILLAREHTIKKQIPNASQLKWIITGGLVLTIIQIGMGTQVRQFVDGQVHSFNLIEASQWLSSPPLLFYFHRSFSILVLLVHGYIGYLLFKNNHIPIVFKLILFLLGVEVLTGIWIYYFDFPFSSQALHLVLASLLFGTQSYFMLILKK